MKDSRIEGYFYFNIATHGVQKERNCAAVEIYSFY